MIRHVEHYPEIISKVTTPLALGALLLLLIFVALNAAAKNLPKSLWTQLLRYGFILTIVAVVLADVAYVATDFARNEMLFRGTVSEENGAPIGSALIDVVGVSRGITDDTGHFLISIPRQSRRNKYAVTFRADGYKTLTDQTVIGPNPEPTSVTLKAITLAGDSLFNIQDLNLAHFVGQPIVWVHCLFKNPLSRDIALSDISLALFSPSGARFQLSYAGVSQFSEKKMRAPVNPIVVARGQTSECILKFQDMRAAEAIGARVTQDLVSHGQSLGQTPKMSHPIVSQQLVNQLKTNMINSNLWSAGTWKLRLQAMVDEIMLHRDIPFELDGSNIKSMQKIADYYDLGAGLINNYTELFTDANPTIYINTSGR